MSALLHIDSSPMGDSSVSRRLTARYAKLWSLKHPGGTVTVRDVSSPPLPAVDAMWVAAAYTPADRRSPAQRTALRVSDELLAEMRAADQYVIGVPMHNFGVPSALKLWIDQIARVGESFNYGETGPVGLITGKKALIIASSGGTYGPDAASLSLNFVEPYLRAVLGFLGISDVDFVTAGGAAQLMAPDADRETFFKPYIDALDARFAA